MSEQAAVEFEREKWRNESGPLGGAVYSRRVRDFLTRPPPLHRNERAGGVGGGIPRGERKADMLGVSYGTVGNDVQPHGGHYDRPLLP
jgi:hypothetical protein